MGFGGSGMGFASRSRGSHRAGRPGRRAPCVPRCGDPARRLGPAPCPGGGEPPPNPACRVGLRPGRSAGMSNARATRPRLHHLAERIGAATSLDGPAEAVAGWIRGIVPKGPVKDTLSGTQPGHALHPLLTDLPIGTWTSASLLDLVGGPAARPAAERLIATGLLAAVPTAASGLNDWADTTPADDGVRRVGAVHAVA